jgi:hypothetical protein
LHDFRIIFAGHCEAPLDLRRSLAASAVPELRERTEPAIATALAG